MKTLLVTHAMPSTGKIPKTGDPTETGALLGALLGIILVLALLLGLYRPRKRKI